MVWTQDEEMDRGCGMGCWCRQHTRRCSLFCRHPPLMMQVVRCCPRLRRTALWVLRTSGHEPRQFSIWTLVQRLASPMAFLWRVLQQWLVLLRSVAF